MNELMRIDHEQEFPIDGRELHEKLGVETPYHKWFPRMCENDFVEGEDFNTDKNVRVQIEGKREVSREVITHHLTLDMAKEICMLSRTDKGREIRRYLIQMEKDWHDPMKVMERAALMLTAELQSVNAGLLELTERKDDIQRRLCAVNAMIEPPKLTDTGAVRKFLDQYGSVTGQPTETVYQAFLAWCIGANAVQLHKTRFCKLVNQILYTSSNTVRLNGKCAKVFADK